MKNGAYGGSPIFRGGGPKKTIIFEELPKKRGIGQFIEGLAKIGRRVFLRQGWYLDAHYDLILVQTPELKIGLFDVSALNFDQCLNFDCSLKQRKK